VGNHERYWDSAYTNYQRYFPAFPKGSAEAARRWYTFSAGPVDVAVLDSEEITDATVNGAQLAWLQTTLRGWADAPDAARRWRVILTHHAPFSSSMANADFIPIGRSAQLRDQYVPLFERFAVDLVLTGHTHVYERSRRGGITYLVGGTAGGFMGVLGADNPHSLVIEKARTVTRFEVDSRDLLMTTTDLQGRVIDRLHLRRQGGLAVVVSETRGAGASL